MGTTAADAVHDAAYDVAILRQQARVIHQFVRVNVEGVTQEESLIQPQPAGNCLNWVLGHLLNTYNGMLPLLGQAPVLEAGTLARYARGSAPLRDAGEALPFAELLAAWDEATARVDAGLAAATPEALAAPAPRSPTGDPNETVRSLLSFLIFHQAYHAGQTGILRRLVGKEGAIK